MLQDKDQDIKILRITSSILKAQTIIRRLHELENKSVGPLHSDADGVPESTTAPQLYSHIGSTCLCPPGTILV